MLRPARYGSIMRNRMLRMARYHQKSFSDLRMLANSAGFMRIGLGWAAGRLGWAGWTPYFSPTNFSPSNFS